MGRRQGARSGAYLNGYVTDPAGAGQPPAHFHRNPPGRWLRRGGFFRVARSLRIKFRYAPRSNWQTGPAVRSDHTVKSALPISLGLIISIATDTILDGL